jgi:hypothetical protein
VQYTIEARALRNDDLGSQRTFVEAADADEAIARFVRLSDAELVSCSRPRRGHESIATVKKQDAFFLVRVYTD